MHPDRKEPSLNQLHLMTGGSFWEGNKMNALTYTGRTAKTVNLFFLLLGLAVSYPMAKARGLQQQKRCESELTSLSLERGYVIQEYIGTSECFSSSEHCGWRLNSPARQGQCCHHKTLYNIGDEDLTAEMPTFNK